MRALVVSLLLLLLVQARAEGQTVGVSAVVVDVTDATRVDYAIQLDGGRFVARRESRSGGGSRLLERAYITRGVEPVIYLVRQGRGVRMETVRGVRALVITRVIAANS